MRDLNISSEELHAISEIPESQKLIQLLQRDGGKTLEHAIRQLRSGAPEKAMELLDPIMRSEKSQELLRQIQSKIG